MALTVAELAGASNPRRCHRFGHQLGRHESQSREAMGRSTTTYSVVLAVYIKKNGCGGGLDGLKRLGVYQEFLSSSLKTSNCCRPITMDYEPPLVPAVADVDALKLSEIDLTVWCNSEELWVGAKMCEVIYLFIF